MKKGYTLVELIIVIAVLFVMGVITLPILLSHINDTRMEEAKAMGYEVIENAKIYHFNKRLEKNGVFDEVTFTCNDTCNSGSESLDLKDIKVNSGKIIIESNGTIKGDITLYDNDYTFYICDGKLYEEEVIDCVSSNKLYLDKKDYEVGEEVEYAGILWNVIKDNGEDTILTTKYVVSSASLGDKTYNYEESLLKTNLNIWFNSNSTLTKAKEQNKLKLMEFSDGNESYSDYVRIPTKDEVKFNKQLDNCNTVFCNIKTAYWLITYQSSSEGIYKSWSIGDDGLAYSLDISNELGIRPVINVIEQ